MVHLKRQSLDLLRLGENMFAFMVTIGYFFVCQLLSVGLHDDDYRQFAAVTVLNQEVQLQRLHIDSHKLQTLHLETPRCQIKSSMPITTGPKI